MLNFQLAKHEKYLRNFIILFKKADADTDGALNDTQFRDLLKTMKVLRSEQDADRLLQVIDEFQNKQITFSECVALFTTVYVEVHFY